MKPLKYNLEKPTGGLGAAGPGIYYKCLQCGFIIDSTSKEPKECRCKNIYLDPTRAAGARDMTKVKILSAPLEDPGLLL